jgi:hypothetical protein
MMSLDPHEQFEDLDVSIRDHLYYTCEYILTGYDTAGDCHCMILITELEDLGILSKEFYD